MSFQQAVADDDIKIMDKAAMGLALEHHLPIIVFNATKTDNICQAARQATRRYYYWRLTANGRDAQ